MNLKIILLALAGLLTTGATQAYGADPMIDSITPVLPVDRIEPSITFFEKIGFKVTTEVPEEDHLGFAIISDGKIDLMYQTRTSIAADTDIEGGSPVLLFVTVPDIDAVAKALGDSFEIVMSRRETFYGATEIGYREPGGHIVTFAEFKAEN
ncbi:VOC family protein [Kordiimonas lipolytica]|uniref:VOC family protein n=1 Tax=Kordiimonas lipolytica TaxID=1662421 RepID=A0ABV8U7Q2_9PROT|nr:VOC family protein [Kordiimonas lipolytica]